MELSVEVHGHEEGDDTAADRDVVGGRGGVTRPIAVGLHQRPVDKTQERLPD